MFNNKGVSHIIVLVAVIVIAAVGFAGWRVYTSEQDNSNETTTVQQPENNDELQNAEDVQALEEDLNATDLEAELDTSDLDADLDELQ